MLGVLESRKILKEFIVEALVSDEAAAATQFDSKFDVSEVGRKLEVVVEGQDVMPFKLKGTAANADGGGLDAIAGHTCSLRFHAK